MLMGKPNLYYSGNSKIIGSIINEFRCSVVFLKDIVERIASYDSSRDVQQKPCGNNVITASAK